MNYKFLTSINFPSDLRTVSEDDLVVVCGELRAFLIDTILSSGGHFSANLGTVELTVALHYIFNTPVDQLIWDVGHQAYGHKVLTGRREELKTIRKKGGLSGFPKISESIYDAFGTGHSSTSISAALGMAEANFLLGNDRQTIAVIGDGSLTAGIAWEAINNGGVSKSNILLVINDNQIGIDPNSGALNNYLRDLSNIEGETIFGSLGWDYSGPIDGHDISELLSALKIAKGKNGPRILHIKTIKGKGYPPAEEEQTKWHAVKYVKIDGGNESEPAGPKYQDVFGATLLELARQNEKIVGLTPAMPSGSSMNKMMDVFPERVFDVGIAEQHAVTFAAGLASQGLIPFCNIYSSFFQRAYDQFVHDVCLQNLPVILCLDRAGVVGEDGPTHHGLYDLAILRSLPNCTIIAPSSAIQLRSVMHWAVEQKDNATVIRYPRGQSSDVNWQSELVTIEFGKSKVIIKGLRIVILSLGALLEEAKEAIKSIEDEAIGLVDILFLKPIDKELIELIFNQYDYIITLEDACQSGGLYSAIVELANESGFKGTVKGLGFPEEVIEHATREELLASYNLDAAGIASELWKRLL